MSELGKSDETSMASYNMPPAVKDDRWQRLFSSGHADKSSSHYSKYKFYIIFQL